VNDTSIKISTSHGLGNIIYRNGYYLFQPDELKDTSMPISLRTMHVPIPRDYFTPIAREKVVKNTDKSDGDEDSEAVWEESLEFSKAIRNGTVEKIPNGLLNEITKLREFSGLVKGQTERFEIILWIYNSIKGFSDIRDVYADIVLEYIWDEYMTIATKRVLHAQNLETVKKVSEDSYWTIEGTAYIRLVNGFTDEIE